MFDLYDLLCSGYSVTLISVDEEAQLWRCNLCGRVIMVTHEMLHEMSSGFYIHYKDPNYEPRREIPWYNEEVYERSSLPSLQPFPIPEAFYKAFEDNNERSN